MSDLGDLVTPPYWMKEALCRDVDRNIFFIEGKNSWLMLQAKLICIGDKPHNECPVRLQCLQYSMRDQWGVFGGTSPHERARLKRAVRRGANVLDEIKKIDAATRTRAEFLQKRKEKTLAVYSQEAQDREDCLKAVLAYLQEHEEATAKELHEELGFSMDITTDTVKIARGRGLLDPGLPRSGNQPGGKQTWRLR